MTDDEMMSLASEIAQNQAVINQLLEVLEDEVENYCKDNSWQMVYRVIGLARSYVANSQGLAESLTEPSSFLVVTESATEG